MSVCSFLKNNSFFISLNISSRSSIVRFFQNDTFVHKKCCSQKRCSSLGSPCMHACINASIIAAQCLYLSRDGHRFKVHFETFFTKWFFKAKNETRLTNRFEKSFWLISVVRIKILHKIINLSSLYF